MINHRELAAAARWEATSKSSDLSVASRGVTLRLASWAGRSPQIINLYVHLNQTTRVQ
jgi:hypothetical protein